MNMAFCRKNVLLVSNEWDRARNNRFVARKNSKISICKALF